VSGQPVVTLRDLREGIGLSLRELERKSGVNRALLSRFERGLASPRRHELRLIESALALPTGSLMPRVLVLLDEEGS
jgi:transcriptional regulator with XRE-family HTH domain